MQQADVAGDGEQEIVVEWRQLRQLVFQHLGRTLCTLTLLLDPRLNSLGKDFVGQLAQPVLEQRTNDVRVVQVFVCDEVDVSIY